jgi:hypothetical protein
MYVQSMCSKLPGARASQAVQPPVQGLRTKGGRKEDTHKEQVVACQHAVLLREGREVVGCAGLKLLLVEVRGPLSVNLGMCEFHLLSWNLRTCNRLRGNGKLPA